MTQAARQGSLVTTSGVASSSNKSMDERLIPMQKQLDALKISIASLKAAVRPPDEVLIIRPRRQVVHRGVTDEKANNPQLWRTQCGWAYGVSRVFRIQALVEPFRPCAKCFHDTEAIDSDPDSEGDSSSSGSTGSHSSDWGRQKGGSHSTAIDKFVIWFDQHFWKIWYVFLRLLWFVWMSFAFEVPSDFHVCCALAVSCHACIDLVHSGSSAFTLVRDPHIHISDFGSKPLSTMRVISRIEDLADEAAAGTELRRYLECRGIRTVPTLALMASSDTELARTLIEPLLAGWKISESDYIRLPVDEQTDCQGHHHTHVDVSETVVADIYGNTCSCHNGSSRPRGTSPATTPAVG